MGLTIINLFVGSLIIAIHDAIGRGHLTSQLIYTFTISPLIFLTTLATAIIIKISLDGKSHNDNKITYPVIVDTILGFILTASLGFMFFWVWSESDLWSNLGTWASTNSFLVWQRLFCTAILALGVGTLSYVPIGVVSELIYSFTALFIWAAIGSSILSVAISIRLELNNDLEKGNAPTNNMNQQYNKNANIGYVASKAKDIVFYISS